MRNLKRYQTLQKETLLPPQLWATCPLRRLQAIGCVKPALSRKHAALSRWVTAGAHLISHTILTGCDHSLLGHQGSLGPSLEMEGRKHSGPHGWRSSAGSLMGQQSLERLAPEVWDRAEGSSALCGLGIEGKATHLVYPVRRF